MEIVEFCNLIDPWLEVMAALCDLAPLIDGLDEYKHHAIILMYLIAEQVTQVVSLVNELATQASTDTEGDADESL